MTKNQRQEALSLAYVQAIAAQAGVGYTRRQTDYGIDLSLHEIVRRGSRYIESGTVLDVQAKSTTRAGKRTVFINYDLDVKAYNDLRDTEAKNPRILILVVLPRDAERWLSQSEEKLTIRHCAYWISLEGWGPTPRRKSVRVRIPRANVFSASGLRAILERCRTRGKP
jgi:hypothetical protein